MERDYRGEIMEDIVNKQVIFDRNYIKDKRKSVQSTFMSWLRQNLKYADESGFSIDNITVNFSVSEKYDDLCNKRTFRHTNGPVDIKNVKIDFEQLKMLLD